MNTSLRSRRFSSLFALRCLRAVGLVVAISLLALLGMANLALGAPDPTFSVDPQGEYFHGSDWTSGVPVTIKVFASPGDSSPIFETTSTPEEGGSFMTYVGYPGGCDLQAGQQVVYDDGAVNKATIITALTVDGVDLGADTVWGQTDFGVGGDIVIYDVEGSSGWFSDDLSEGRWSYDFTATTGLQNGWGGRVGQTDADGDATVVDWHVPDPHFVVDPGSAQIRGQDWGLLDDVTVRVYAAGSPTPKLTQTSGIEDDWSFIIDSDVTIRAGDRVVATDGTTVTSMTVSPLTITSFDYTTGVTSGICTAKNPPPEMHGGIDAIGGGPIFPSAAGTWTATLDWRPIVPLPLPPGTEGWIEESDPSGNATQARWHVPNKPIAVDHEFTVIEDATLIENFLPGGFYNGPTLDASFTTQPKHGTVDFWPSMGGFEYRPAPGFIGTDTFQYSIADSTPWQTLWSDPATITVTVRPWYLGYSSLSTTTIQLQWPDVADTLTDFGHYLLTDDGSVVASTTGTTLVLDGLQPGSAHVFGVCLVDASGHESQLRNLTITMPQQSASANVEVTDTATAGLVVRAPGSSGGESGLTATVTVVITDVTTGGQLTLVRADAPPADAPPTLKFLDEYFDLGFTGTFTGTVTISVPYDPRIPDSRALELKLQHWTSDHWEDLATTVDLVKHTLTASLTSLSPIVVAEPLDAVTAAKIVVSKPVLYPAYGARATVTASLFTNDLAATPLSGFTLVLERLRGTSWSQVATLSAVAVRPGSYRASAAPVGGVRTVYRVRLTANVLYTATNRAVYVVPHAKLTTPRPSKTSVTHGRRFYINGQVYPKRAMYVYVRIYRYSRGAYRYSSTSRAKSTTSGSYRLSLALKKTGSYKFKAYVGDDKWSATVARTYSPLSARVRVR